MTSRKINFPEYQKISRILSAYDAYLVGGAVRDLLLGRPVRDLDFALPDKVRGAAKDVADQLGGAYYVLDEERDTARVILRSESGFRSALDFTTFQGADLSADLGARDFTITAMALPLEGDRALIDPLGGARDLRKGLIKACSPTALGEDPIRTLRAVRMAVDLDFRIETGTKDLIREAAPGLEGVSPERVRDELFRILENRDSAAALRAMKILGLTPYVLPDGIGVPEERIRVLACLDGFWQTLAEEYDPEKAADLFSGMLVTRLGRYREKLTQRLNTHLVPGRNLKGLVHLTSLFPEPGEGLNQVAAHLKLSGREIQRVEQIRRGAGAFLEDEVYTSPEVPIQAYRFFKHFVLVGVEGIFLALARERSRRPFRSPAVDWSRLLDGARFYLEAWWEKHDRWVEPELLLDGHQLMEAFELTAGPWVGNLLERIREAQVTGQVETPGEALQLAEQILDQDLQGDTL